LDDKFVIDVALQILAALEYLHGQSPPIVYRDLKPANVMVTPDGDVKLIDFGVARLFIPKKTATMVGTMGYAPPEQYEGKAEPRSDIYALGATMFHLLTGWDPGHHAPFMIPPIGTLRTDINPALAALLTESLMLDPRRRISSAASFRNGLEAIVRPSAEPARPIAKRVSKSASAPASANASSAPTVISLSRLLCPNCGRAVAPAVRYCTHCRADLKELTERKARQVKLGVKWSVPVESTLHALARGDDGAIYTGVAGKSGPEDSLNAHDPDSGRMRWSFTVEATINSVAPGPRGAVYAAISANNARVGERFALTPGRGEPKRAIATAFAGQTIAAGRDGFVYVAGRPDTGTARGALHAIKLPWATRKWSFTSAHEILALSVGPDGASIYAVAANLVYSIDPADGNCKWSFVTSQHLRWSVAVNGDASREFSFISGSRLLALATGADGGIYAGSDDGNLYAIGPYGNFRWSCVVGNPVHAIAAGRDGTIYVATANEIRAVGSDGSPKWSYASPAAVGYISAGDDETIYAGLGDRSLCAFRL
ncbi:MAG TPA: PQQ-binding-like beta-propeller repeat protein, partial [Candidatus Binataceae bacterium]|nr:PQQ-binding-like beta-propeller repeat protein [Candidatus Binataceae bacterium]